MARATTSNIPAPRKSIVIRRYTSDNMQRAYTAYDYQTTAGDCPRLSGTRVWAENWTGINGLPAEVVTQYSEAGDGFASN